MRRTHLPQAKARLRDAPCWWRCRRPAKPCETADNEPKLPKPPASTPVNCKELVERIQTGDPAAIEEFHRLFSNRIRFFLYRHLGPHEADERLRDTLSSVVQAIQRGELQNPQCLTGLVQTVVGRQLSSSSSQAVQERCQEAPSDGASRVLDQRNNPEQEAIAHEQTEIMQKVVLSLSPRDRGVLTRFYLLGQPQEQICAKMGLNETQFRLLKSKVKARFAELAKLPIRAPLHLGGFLGPHPSPH